MMAADNSTKSNSNAKLLEELEALSESLYQSHTTARRAASLALPRTSAPFVPLSQDDNDTAKFDNNKNSNKPRSRRMSLSRWLSETKHEDSKKPSTHQDNKNFDETQNSDDKKGIWNWKPIRALSHVGKQKLSCLFSVEVITAQSLPSSMNGLRLSVCVRKKETKDGSVHTMPSRVSQGASDFEETLFMRCHIYCTSGKQKQLKFEPRPFWIYLFAVDAKELNFGRSSVDLSELIQESIEKSKDGTRVKQWEKCFSLSGKAKGGELILKLGFQIIDGGVEIYNQEDNLNLKSSSRFKNLTSSFARRQSKTSFSMATPKITSRNDAWTPSMLRSTEDIQGMDYLNLDDDHNLVNESSLSTQKLDDLDLQDFEVIEKGVEVQEGSEKSIEVKSASSEVVKEIVHAQLHLARLTELDSLAKQIKALESMIGGENNNNFMKDFDTESQRLDADEENLTREFLQMLEDQETSTRRGYKTNQSEMSEIPHLQLEGHDNENENCSSSSESKVYLPDLGKGLGCVIQTREGGYLASLNPLDNIVARNETPKLAMQMSKPFVLTSKESLKGLELFQSLASIGIDELTTQISSLMPIDELIGKTAEQIAFEGIASAIIQGRNKEGASSSAARIVSALKEMANAMSSGREKRISTGIWNVDESLLTAEKILAFTMQKIEFMAIEALKIQAGMSEEEAPFDVSSTNEVSKDENLLSSAISLEDWIRDQSYKALTQTPDTTQTQTSVGTCQTPDTSSTGSVSATENITMMFVVQLRDPIRRFEAVGGPMMVLVHATSEETKGKNGNNEDDEEEKKFKVNSMYVGGFKVRSGTTKKNVWETEKQRLTAMQWLIEYGLGKGGKKGKQVIYAKGQDSLWSISSTILADMWLKTIRNPDIKLVK